MDVFLQNSQTNILVSNFLNIYGGAGLTFGKTSEFRNIAVLFPTHHFR